MRISGAAIAACVSAAMLSSAAGAAAKPPPKKPVHRAFIPHLCVWIAASDTSQLELQGACHEGRAHLKTVHTPIGEVTTTFYNAKWGTSVSGLVPQHLLSVSAIHVTGSPGAVTYFVKARRLEVSGEGELVDEKAGVVATWQGQIYACENPPTSHCVKDYFHSVKGSWGVEVGTVGAPPGSPGAVDEPEPPEDSPQDRAQEELLRTPTVSIGLAVLAKV